MPKNTCQNCFSHIWDYFILHSLHVLIHHLKMELLRWRIRIYLRQIKHFYSKWRFRNILDKFSLYNLFLINRMLSNFLVGNMLYSVLLSNKSLFLVEPKIFGSACYVRDVWPSITKLDPKALEYVFLGYSQLQKRYWCYSTELGK